MDTDGSDQRKSSDGTNDTHVAVVNSRRSVNTQPSTNNDSALNLTTSTVASVSLD